MAARKNIFEKSQAARTAEQKEIKKNNGITEGKEKVIAEKKDNKADSKKKKENPYTNTITLSIMPDDHKQLKILAIQTGKKMNELLHDMISNYKV